MKKRINLLFVFLCFCFASANAQSKEEVQYKKESEEIRKQIWAWDKPQFKVKDVPAQYANASKVILAHHIDLAADSKSKFKFYGVTFFTKKEQTLNEVVREMVKLNDKNAITEYSELSFTRFEKTSGFLGSNKMTTYIGFRIIKPNGTIKEINTDDIVLTKDEAKEKVAKIAVPDLQPGDILDYFISTEQSLTNDYSTKAYRLSLFDDAPILSLSFHAELGKKYAIEYKSYNAAPELQVSKNADKDIMVDVEKTNIPPFETSLWVAYPRQLPYIRMNISMGYKGLGSRILDTNKPGEVIKITDGERVMEDKANSLSSEYYSGYWMKAAKAQYDDIEEDAKKRAKQMGLVYKDLSNEEKAALLFYTLRFTHLLNFDIDALSKKVNIGENEYNGLAFVIFCTFKASGLDPAILISDDRTGPRINEVMNAGELSATTYIPGVKKYFSIQTPYSIPFSIPESIEGAANTKSFTFDHPAAIMSMKKMEGLTNVAPGPAVPVSSSKENARIERIKLSLSPDKSLLSVNRSTTLRGLYKPTEQRRLILYEDYYEAERLAFKEEKSLIAELEDGKKTKKYVEEVRNAFAEARKKQKTAFEKEAKEWFEQDITDLKNYKTDNLGVRHTSPDFVYSSSFNMAGLVKKAGNNIIVEIGKIQGQPLVVKDEQRKRNIDVYAPFARSIEYEVELDIPDGYTAEGVAALNTKVENEAGYFITEATATDKIVSIKIKKHYLKNFEPVKNWEKLLSFMDASQSWTNAKLLFKKK